MGLGYVGLPLAVAFAEADYRVIGVDLDKKKVEALRRGKSHIGDVDSGGLAKLVNKGLILPVTDYSRLKKCDAINVCVPTPFTGNKDPDISYIRAASKEISKILRPGHLIVLRSTTYPETTDKVMLPILEESGLVVGEQFFLVFAPERIDPGNKKYGFKNTPVVVGGVTSDCTRLGCLLYEKICDQTVPVSSPRVAEMSKLLENIFRSVNIALVNEIARLCDRMGNMDIWEVIDAASTKPFGFMPFYPGPGIGGHCILVDPYYLSWKAREYDFHTNFVELAAETNENMPYYVVGKIIEALSRVGVCPSKARVLFLGVAFKRDVADTRNSPAIKVMGLIEGKVGGIAYNDPYVETISINDRVLESVPISDEVLEGADCVVITADHTAYDYRRIAEASKVVVDTRNATRNLPDATGTVYKLGKGF